MLRAEVSAIQIPMTAQFFVLVHAVPTAHPFSCAKDTGYVSLAQSDQGVALTTHPFQRRGCVCLKLYLFPPRHASMSCYSVKFAFHLITTNVSPTHTKNSNHSITVTLYFVVFSNFHSCANEHSASSRVHMRRTFYNPSPNPKHEPKSKYAFVESNLEDIQMT